MKKIVIFFLILLSCKQDEIKKRDLNPIIKSIAIYYDEPYDSVNEFYRFDDSNEIKTTHLKFYHFYDLRDTTNEKEHWVEGIIAINDLTGNHFIFSSKLKGESVYRADALSKHPIRRQNSMENKVYFTDSSIPRYSDTFFSRQRNVEFGLLSDKNTGLALKLSAILNDLPINIKAKMTRAIMDSMIKAYFFKEINTLIGSGIHKEVYSLNIADTNRIKERYEVTENSLANLLRHKDFSMYKKQAIVKKFASTITFWAGRQSVFIYPASSTLTLKSYWVIVTLNEYLPDSLSSENFYSIFCKEPIMYDVRVYAWRATDFIET